MNSKLAQPCSAARGDLIAFSGESKNLLFLQSGGDFDSQSAGEVVVAGAGEGEGIELGLSDSAQGGSRRGDNLKGLDGMGDCRSGNPVVLLASLPATGEDAGVYKFCKVPAR